MIASTRDLFILVSDDALLSRTLTQLTLERAEMVVISNVAQALTVDRRRVRGVILDGAQIKLQVVRELTRLRTAFPLAHLLFVATAAQTMLVNDVQPLRVELLARPLPAPALSSFVERALSAGRLSERHVRAWIEEMACECRLTRRDVALMPLVLEEETAEATCARLGVDEMTLQRALRRLVKKCRMRNTDRLAKNLLRDALLFSREATADLIEPLSARAASLASRGKRTVATATENMPCGSM
jgi:FixJ family two-component response regulator